MRSLYEKGKKRAQDLTKELVDGDIIAVSDDNDAPPGAKRPRASSAASPLSSDALSSAPANADVGDELDELLDSGKLRVDTLGMHVAEADGRDTCAEATVAGEVQTVMKIGPQRFSPRLHQTL